ncbi:DUF6504 family protein [Ornithinimicrobium sp. F0845]|uniref:DUF6504 family protein n=1 Tax=Ornithinimicrobium sp. F0845 TaxID=2926412 RepID=UPI001FF3F49A|nr:DUF6504 family protein [Ornithinimicrobium sp. F0845]MCK0111693.1 DUF6504 family protein [Ornithinimicrobium sp. F0845]
MSRRYADPVEVRVGGLQLGRLPVLPAGVDAASAPTAFIWRGRLHVVCAVLDHWTQRLSWWREPSGDSGAGSNGAGPDGAGSGDGRPDRFPDLEREVWRVEASAGRLMQTGVYDLTKDDRWRLVRVAD